MICSNCRMPAEAGEVFCGNCGVRLATPVVAPPSPLVDARASAVGLGLLLILVLGVVLWYTVFRTSESSGAVGQDAVRAEVVAAVRAASEAEIDAHRTQDLTPLYRAYAGEALKTQIDLAAALQGAQRRQLADLRNRVIHGVTLSDEQGRAEVQMTETWHTRILSTVTGDCLFQIPEHVVPQTVHMALMEGRWMVVRIDFVDAVQPAPVQC